MRERKVGLGGAIPGHYRGGSIAVVIETGGHYGDHFQMATRRCPGKEHSVPGVWTELSLRVPGGEQQNLPEGWEADAGIPDPSRTTPTSGFAACVSPEGERLGTILPPAVLFCTGL